MNIEYVCRANNGRSPLAAAISIEYLSSHSKKDCYIGSSGTTLDKLTSVQEGKLIRVIEPQIISAIKKDLLPDCFMEKLKTSPREAVDAIFNIEKNNREQYLSQRGLKGKSRRDQTKVCQNSNYIFCFGDSNAQFVKKIYSNTSVNPAVITISNPELDRYKPVLTYKEFEDIAKPIEEITLDELKKIVD